MRWFLAILWFGIAILNATNSVNSFHKGDHRVAAIALIFAVFAATASANFYTKIIEERTK